MMAFGIRWGAAKAPVEEEAAQESGGTEGGLAVSQLLPALGALHEKQYAHARDLGRQLANEAGAAIEAVANMFEFTFKSLSMRGSAMSIQASESIIALSQMSGNVKAVVDNTSKIASSAEELSASFHEIAATSEHAAGDARAVREESDSSMAEVERARETMEKISSEVGSITGRISVLQEAVNQIAEMTRTIEDISNQTNLLALNATIEAARAGEAGKGFAVVAAEVKTLSQQTANATVQISERTDALRNEMDQMMSMIETSAAAVTEGEEIVSNVAQRFHSVSGRISEVSNNIAQIAGTLSQQTGAADEISVSISKIAERATANRAAVSKIAEQMSQTEAMIDEQFGYLEKHQIPGFIIDRAKSDHAGWKRKVAEVLLGLSDLKAKDLADHRGCRLGRWLDSADAAELAGNPHFKGLPAPHQRFHTHAAAALQAHEQGSDERAWAEFAEMEKASGEVLALLGKLDALYDVKNPYGG